MTSSDIPQPGVTAGSADEPGSQMIPAAAQQTSTDSADHNAAPAATMAGVDSADTSSESQPPAPSGEPVSLDGADDGPVVVPHSSDLLVQPSRFGSIWWGVGGALLAMVVLVGILAVSIRSSAWGVDQWDQYVMKPGSATSATDAIVIDGVELFPPEGGIAFTTVAILRDPTLLDLARAKYWNEGSRLVDPVLIDGDRSRTETRQVTQFQMNVSQDSAAVLALNYLGYELETIEEGAIVTFITPDSAAEGVLAFGDLIVGIDDTVISNAEQIQGALIDKAPGDQVTLQVERAASREVEELTITLGQRPPDPPDAEVVTPPELFEVGFLGIGSTTRAFFDLPFQVGVDVGEVRGPSAGLAFTLAIVEVLTPGELTGGLKVATTGTISIDGTVGPVGGVEQKTVAARQEGIDLFLVPPAEFEEATQFAGDMAVRSVATFDEALEVLAEFGGNAREVQGSLAPAING